MPTPNRTAVLLDDVTANLIGWQDIWRQFQPVSPYGLQWKAEAKPFVNGEEDECNAVLMQLEADATQLDHEDTGRLRDAMRRLPDVRDVLTALSASEFVLHPKQALLLKQFAFYGRVVAEDKAVVSLLGDRRGLWSELLSALEDTESPSFSLEQIGGEAYIAFGKAVSEALAKLARAVQHRDQTFVESVGKKLNREGLIVLQRPTESGTAERLKAHEAVRWVKDTPFESVFEALPTPEMMDAKAKCEAAQQALDAHSTWLMQQLTDTVRAQISLWRDAVQFIQTLDVRIGKVDWLRKMNGCVPKLGDSVTLVDGVNLVVQERLQQRGAQFTPLCLELGGGVSVICGSNMGGKTVAMITLSVCQALAQYGMPVPAKRFEAVLFRAIRFSGSADTDTASGLSSFGSEVDRWAQIWTDATSGGPVLLCFDEPGRSTNPVEGEALTVGLIRALRREASPGTRTLIATHFAAPLREPGIHLYRVRGLREDLLPANEAIRDANERMVHLEQAMSYHLERILDGDVPQEAVRVAEWMGAPASLLEEASAFLHRGNGQ